MLPGVWRLRLPLPWPGVPHCNAWALAAGDGIVLVDCGMHEPGSMGHLERALAQVNLNLDLVRLLVCTHAHSDHYGNAATIVERTGCELWMHPNHDHMLKAARDPEAAFDRRIEVALQSGVPEEPLRRYSEARRGTGFGIAGIIEPNRNLVPGIEVHTDLGTWQVYETPGHAPSHVCLYQEERRILISGDHLLGRVSLYYDYGYSPDPAGEFLHSLDLVQELDARLCLSGHGRTFTDVQAHINANRTLVRDRLARVEEVVRTEPGLTAYEIIPEVYGAAITPFNANWWLSETLAYLRHLEVTERLERVGESPERWAAKP
ncbi:MBL fold metallo-hydrolase [Conexibacter woesei]|uniref:MBL fold metallo-hydrolase n=1 Tax=Conexibacter woesei TaxID=191495 RepID=UPI001E390860|nr:MBL fold metallo-hydrolase [Conexibacter woesei]